MYKPPYRFWICIMVFLTTFMNYSLRINFSIAIIDMVTKIHKTPECFLEPDQKAAKGSKFDWDETIQAHLLAAYSYGYSATGIIGGILAENFGAYNMLIIVNIGQIFFNSLSVWWLDINHHWVGLFVVRLILGLLGGLVYPAVQVLISKWAPPMERGRFVSCLRGNFLGTAITYSIVGAIVHAYDWKWGIHATSLMFLAYTILFWIIAGNNPQAHEWVSDAEKEYIATAQMGTVSQSNVKKIPPYSAIFTSVPFWALNIAHFGNGWGLYLQMTGLAKFLKEVLGFNLKTSGFLSAFPFLLSLIVTFTTGTIGDFLIQSGKYKKNVIRKGFIIMSHILPGICLCFMMLVNCDGKVLAIALLTLAQGINGASVLTNMRNSQDLAPNFAGTLYGTINSFSGMTGVFTPFISAALINAYGGLMGYKLAFLIGGMVYIVSGIIFIIFGSAEEQPWNKLSDESSS